MRLKVTFQANLQGIQGPHQRYKILAKYLFTIALFGFIFTFYDLSFTIRSSIEAATCTTISLQTYTFLDTCSEAIEDEHKSQVIHLHQKA